MKINDELLKKLETLSMLKIEKDKRDEVIKQLNDIVNFVENLNELDLENEKADFAQVSGGTPLREDIVKRDLALVDMVLKHAPKSDGRFFSVPTIIE